MNKKQQALDISGPLADSMDQSIGEVTTVMGAMITELMRRSLRGGVVKIGEELQSLVIDKVETAVAERVPEVERAAIAAAEETAQIAAAKVAAEEVHALDAKTGETTRRLATQIEEVERKAQGAVETTRQTAEQLSGQIVETEKRVCEMTQAEIDQRLNKVLEKSRETATTLKARLATLEELSEGLGRQIREERTSREGDMRSGFAKVQQGLDQLGQTLTRGVELCQARLKDEVSVLRQANEGLAARVTALEQPKGLFARWFGKRKDKGEAET